MSRLPPPIPRLIPPQPAPPRPPASARAADVSPVLLSAAVWPGAGQLLQRRWAAAAFFLALFTACAGWLIWVVYRVLAAYYAFALHFDTASGQAPGISAVGRPFLACAVLYLGNLLDTSLADARARRSRGARCMGLG